MSRYVSYINNRYSTVLYCIVIVNVRTYWTLVVLQTLRIVAALKLEPSKLKLLVAMAIY